MQPESLIKSSTVADLRLERIIRKKSLTVEDYIEQAKELVEKFPYRNKIKRYHLFKRKNKTYAALEINFYGLEQNHNDFNQIRAGLREIQKSSSQSLLIIPNFPPKTNFNRGFPIEQADEIRDFYRNRPKLNARNLENDPYTYLDYSDNRFISIDPEGALDIDDVFHLKKTDYGYDLMIGIADCSWLIPSVDHPLMLNGRRFGSTLYSPQKALYMLSGYEIEHASFLKGKTRYAWVLEFKLDHRGNPLKFDSKFKLTSEGLRPVQTGEVPDKVYFDFSRAKVKNYAKISYDTEIEELENEEDQQMLKTAHQLGAILFSNRLRKDNYHIETKFPNQRLISELMILTYSSAAERASEVLDQAFYTVHTIGGRLNEADIAEYSAQLKEFNVDTDVFNNYGKLFRLVSFLINHEKDKYVSIGYKIKGKIFGKSSYQLTPDLHEALDVIPYMNFKPRKLDGLLNQLIYEKTLYPLNSVDINDRQMRFYLNRIINTKEELPYNNAKFYYLMSKDEKRMESSNL